MIFVKRKLTSTVRKNLKKSKKWWIIKKANEYIMCHIIENLLNSKLRQRRSLLYTFHNNSQQYLVYLWT